MSPLNVVQVQLLIIFDQNSHPVLCNFSGLIAVFVYFYPWMPVCTAFVHICPGIAFAETLSPLADIIHLRGPSSLNIVHFHEGDLNG
jgi:hypothetical protein